MNQLASALSSSTATREEIYSSFKELRHIYEKQETRILHFEEKATWYIYEKQETRILHFEEKATWLSIGYVIFGAVLYNTSLQYYSRKELLLLNRWIPISLLLSVSVAFWLQLVRTVRRYLGISHQSDISWIAQERMYYRLFIMNKNGQRKFSHDKSLDWESRDLNSMPTLSSSSHQRYAYIFTVLSALSVFTLAVLHACLSILCSSDA